MRIGMSLSYAGDFAETAGLLPQYEAAGLEVLFVPEAYSFDAVSRLGFLAARTTTLQLASGILNIYSRTPALLAMTAAGLDDISGGRFTLGIGSSGPQVIEGFHGVPYEAPVGRTREVVEVCRQVWRREPVEFHGRHIDVPLSVERGGSGLGRPLALINRPVRSRVPMMLAALGPKNVALAAECFDAWEPVLFYPEASRTVFGPTLAEGATRRDPSLGPLDVVVHTQVLLTDDADEEAQGLERVREGMALYVGGMGARGKNFYNELVARYGFAGEAAEVQDLYLAGRRTDATKALPEELVRGVSLVGPRGRIADRLAAMAEVGVTTLNANLLASAHAERLRTVEVLRSLG